MKRLVALLVLVAALVGVVLPASAEWLAGTGAGAGYSRGKAMPAGNTPTVAVSGSTATVTWPASAFAGGPNVAGYVIRRFDASTSVQAPTAGTCSGIVIAPTLTCQDTGVPAGSWKWTVQPVHGLWGGAQSGFSATHTVVATLPAQVIADGASFYYRLGESAGPNALDSAGGHTATYGTTGITYGVTGVLPYDANTAVTSTGSSFVGTYSGSGIPVPTTAHSMELWFKTTTTTHIGLMGWGNNGNSHYLALQGGNTIVYSTSGNTQGTVAAPSAANGAWHHVVLTHAGGTVRIYYDGTLVATQAGLTLSSNVASLRIGGSPRNTAQVPNYVGTLDEVAIYPVALTASQVANHWAARL